MISTLSNGPTQPWYSILRYEKLHVKKSDNFYQIDWDEHTTTNNREMISLSSYLNKNNKGLELKDLIAYCGELYTFDQTTGIIYIITQNSLIPRHIIMSGDGLNTESFPFSWTVIKKGLLYVGSSGLDENLIEFHHKEIEENTTSSSSSLSTSSSLSISYRSYWVAFIDPSGRVNHIDWTKEYTSLNIATRIDRNHQMLRHEAVIWSDLIKMWLFFPTIVTTTQRWDSISRKLNLRKTSLQYEDSTSFSSSTSSSSSLSSLRIIICSEDFRSITVRMFRNVELPQLNLQEQEQKQKYRCHTKISSAKALPDTKDTMILAILTVKYYSIDKSNQTTLPTRSFMMVFGLNGIIYGSLTEISSNHPFQSSSTDISYSGIELL